MATVIYEFAELSRSKGMQTNFSTTADELEIVAGEYALHSPSQCTASPEIRLILQRGVVLLEMFQIGSVVWEFTHKNSLVNYQDLRGKQQELHQCVRAAIADYDSRFLEIQSLLSKDLTSNAPVSKEFGRRPWGRVVKSFSVIVEMCPIDEILALAKAADSPKLAHRATLAYEGLLSFVRRHDPHRAEKFRIVGDRYQQGHLRIKEVAQLLETNISNAIFELEQSGYGRTAAAIALAESERDAILAALRRDRIARKSVYHPDLELVKQELIATERIEGVDVRDWVRVDA